MKMTFKFKIAVIILFCVLVGCTNAPPVSIEEMSGVLRSTVEKMPEEKRIPILAYLDRARPIADDGILYLVEGDKGKFYDLMVDQYKEKYSQEKSGNIVCCKTWRNRLHSPGCFLPPYEMKSRRFEKCRLLRNLAIPTHSFGVFSRRLRW